MSTTRELYQLTRAAKALIAEFSETINAAGNIAGVVRRDCSSIAVHLSFGHVSMGAEQAVALQTAAMAIALRSAIADVEKVDDKVQGLQRLVRAREIGEVIGLFRDLERVVEGTQRVGRILDTPCVITPRHSSVEWRWPTSCRPFSSVNDPPSRCDSSTTCPFRRPPIS